MSHPRKQAFFRGFTAALASPCTLFLPPHERYEGIVSKDLVARSWRKVGQSLESAINTERQRHGETAQE